PGTGSPKKRAHAPGSVGGPQYATSYDLLFAAARDDFVATSDTALRALLGEFRDHGLVAEVSSSSTNSASGLDLGAGGTALWIPMRRDVLEKVLEGL
ncbi:hypothetical protein BD410DRAFT_702605, partial [Rickenella mellea]